jgi:glutathione S-transferase
MSKTIQIAPVRKSILVQATAARAFEVFTAGIDRWWPKTHGICGAPLQRSLIEPFAGGRWLQSGADGGQAVVGHVRHWEPAVRFLVTWEVGADWKPDARVQMTSEVEVLFHEESPGVTRVDLEHRHFERMGDAPGSKMRNEVDNGWPGLLSMFAREAQASPSAGDFVVHSVPGSPYGRAVLLILEEKQVPYTLVPVAPASMRSADHLQHHPFGRIPVLYHRGFRVYETQAILRYADRVLPQPSFTPSDPQAAARMDQLMNVNDWYVFLGGVGNVIAFQRVVGPRVMGLTPDEAAIAAAMPKAQIAIDELARQLGQQDYFTGSAPSLADLMLAPQLELLTATPEWPLLTARHANLQAWMARMLARPGMAATTWERVATRAQAA